MATSPCLRFAYDETDFDSCPLGGRDSHEDRWCPACERYKETCDDACTECGEDT